MPLNLFCPGSVLENGHFQKTSMNFNFLCWSAFQGWSMFTQNFSSKNEYKGYVHLRSEWDSSSSVSLILKLAGVDFADSVDPSLMPMAFIFLNIAWECHIRYL